MKQIICGYEIEFSYDHSCKKHIATNESIGLAVQEETLCKAIDLCKWTIPALIGSPLESINDVELNIRFDLTDYGPETKKAIEKING